VVLEGADTSGLPPASRGATAGNPERAAARGSGPGDDLVADPAVFSSAGWLALVLVLVLRHSEIFFFARTRGAGSVDSELLTTERQNRSKNVLTTYLPFLW
jgi:hypothetical protein